MLSIYSTYVPLDYLPIILGWLSCIAWVIALMPQMWKNYKRKECESISTTFMMAWLFGDIGSVIGNILLDGPVTLSILFAYFCSTDVVMLSQMYYYARVYKGRQLPTTTPNPSATKTPLYAVLLLATGALAFSQVCSHFVFVILFLSDTLTGAAVVQCRFVNRAFSSFHRFMQ